MTSEGESPIKSNRYRTGLVLGKGTWGTVYSADDILTGARVAVKVLTPIELAQQQMDHRNLTPTEVMQKEAGFRAARHVLPRMYELDENGRPFLIMPICPGTLDQILREEQPRGHRNSIKLGYPDNTRGHRYIADIFRGLGELHTIYSRTYGDWKPANVMVDEQDRLILNDLGTSSCISIGRSSSPRDNMGHLQTRAQELFFEGSHPTRASDIYGATALAFKIHTGEYPLEETYESIINSGASQSEIEEKIRRLLEEQGNSGIRRLIRDKIKKNTPKEFWEFYEWGLKFEPGERFGDADLALREFNEAVRKTSTEYKMHQITKRHGMSILVPLFLIGTLAGGGYLRKFNTALPPTPSLQGPLYVSDKAGAINTEFERESLTNLPSAVRNGVVDASKIDRRAADVTHDNTTAYLLAQYDRVVTQFGGVNVNFINTEQQTIWLAHSSDGEKSLGNQSYMRPYNIVAKNIELALNQARLPNGNIDLEDVCAISRIRRDRVDLAKRAAGSFNYQVYSRAKDPSGKYIIPKEEQKFLDQWLSYIQDRSNLSPKK